MKVSKRFAVAVTGLGVAAALIGGGVASADPGPVPANAYDRPLQGVGSDTLDDVMNALGEVKYDVDNNPATPDDYAFASWNAKGGAFTSRSAANTPAGSNCTYADNTSTSGYTQGVRADGSGSGQKALRDAFTSGQPTFGCLDFSRSSSLPSAANLGAVSVKAFELATDSLAFAVKEPSSVTRALTLSQLRGAYHCSFGQFTNSTTSVLKAIIPQSGSGTRKSWLEKMYVDGQPGSPTDAAGAESMLASGTWKCVTDRTDFNGVGYQAGECSGTPQVCTLPTGVSFIQEHDLAALTTKSIAPISVAQWESQAFGTIPDKRAGTLLGTLKVTATGEVSYPVSLNGTYGDMTGTADDLIMTRKVYNVVPTSTLTAGSLVSRLFEGPSAYLCQQTATIKKYGFSPLATCGTATAVN
jgi:ABC-type phosphate transport system substrate-binding protein